MLVATAAAILGACAPASDQRAGTALEQGRIYTTWLYQRQFQELWTRFSPEMQETFGNAEALGDFAGHAMQQLGPEQGPSDEQVVAQDSLQVYTRTASFARAADPVLIQWSLTDDGRVTGLVVRPAPQRAP